jgi:hypothetical protein
MIFVYKSGNVGVRHEPLAVPDAEEPVPVGALPEAVGVAAALEPALLMQLSTQDYFC